MTGAWIGVHIDPIVHIGASDPTVPIVPIDLIVRIGRSVQIARSVQIGRIDRIELNVRRVQPVAEDGNTWGHRSRGSRGGRSRDPRDLRRGGLI
jgi:hypothetical protein